MLLYHVLIGFLLGIIFTTVSILYVFFRLLSKKVDPRLHPIKKKQQQNLLSSSHSSSQQRGGAARSLKPQSSFIFSSSNEPFDFNIGKDTPPASIETCKWINFVTKRVLSEINHSQQFSKHIQQFFNNIAENESKPDFIGKLSFSDINIGTTTPEIGTIKLISPINASVNVIEFDLIYSGDASITASSELWLNWPQKYMACLPVKTKVSIKQFSGSFVLHIPNHTNPMCSLYLKETPSLTLRMVTKMGHDTVLKEPGKIGSFIQNLIIKQLNQKLVNPNRISFPLFTFLHPLVVNTITSSSSTTTTTTTTTTSTSTISPPLQSTASLSSSTLNLTSPSHSGLSLPSSLPSSAASSTATSPNTLITSKHSLGMSSPPVSILNGLSFDLMMLNNMSSQLNQQQHGHMMKQSLSSSSISTLKDGSVSPALPSSKTGIKHRKGSTSSASGQSKSSKHIANSTSQSTSMLSPPQQQQQQQGLSSVSAPTSTSTSPVTSPLNTSISQSNTSE